MEIYARHAQIYQRHVPCNLHPNASAAAAAVAAGIASAAAAAASLRGQYAGQNDGQDVNVVTQTHTHTHTDTCVCWRIRFLMFWGLALKNALPNSNSSDGGHSKKLLEIFLALFLTMPRHARHAKATDEWEKGVEERQANRSARVGVAGGNVR